MQRAKNGLRSPIRINGVFCYKTFPQLKMSSKKQHNIKPQPNIQLDIGRLLLYFVNTREREIEREKKKQSSPQEVNYQELNYQPEINGKHLSFIFHT